ncbi:hypothetical protein GN244_ATG20794 [Phytophthora infestans]|uniref:Uncharacterized protein n=1 Tax=Phytophthora infestans TaxID=4787 RepID=A0A833SFY7_PHYIN|nr:hypothetical protein GN244_ATG20794 [Phytophthora infestans]KAF4133555.1 hypothetical protein GN958_ATG17253 [Phytophthora infestans]KAF4136610.1 hypothetical protein GN958_ATG14192 [Phytophthora infestans]
MKIIALVVAAALATTSAYEADTPALRALADVTEETEAPASDTPTEGDDQQEWRWGRRWGGGWGRPRWGGGWGRPGWGGGWGRPGWGGGW